MGPVQLPAASRQFSCQAYLAPAAQPRNKLQHAQQRAVQQLRAAARCSTAVDQGIGLGEGDADGLNPGLGC